jgi:anaphase-promoting complex subunit 8
MLDSMYELEESAEDNGLDAQMQEPEEADTEDAISSTTEDPEDARLERKELPRYLLAKSYFDCREFDRCAAIFLPMTLPKGEIPVSKAKPATPTTTSPTESKSIANGQLSQKALFLALYAQYMAGEKRRDEESETILGPQDGSKTANRELLGIQQRLKAWFDQQEQEGSVIVSQGWLEYLYGIVLRRQKNEKEAKEFLIRSVTIYQYNWGAWQELGDLINSVAEVRESIAILDTVLTMFSSMISPTIYLKASYDSSSTCIRSNHSFRLRILSCKTREGSCRSFRRVHSSKHRKHYCIIMQRVRECLLENLQSC